MHLAEVLKTEPDTSVGRASVGWPLSDSKELIGGFAVMELSGIEETIEMCRRYAAILVGPLEIDVRLVGQGDEAA